MRKRPVTRALLLLLVTAIGLSGCAAEAPLAAPVETEAVPRLQYDPLSRRSPDLPGSRSI